MAFAFLDQLPNSPIVTFTVLLLAVLIVPPVFERLRLPGLVGLLVAGVVLGQDGLRLLDPDTETMKLLSDIGKIYLMFVAGLEIDPSDSALQRLHSHYSAALQSVVYLALGGMPPSCWAP